MPGPRAENAEGKLSNDICTGVELMRASLTVGRSDLMKLWCAGEE